jgi:predicted dehydrogenase
MMGDKLGAAIHGAGWVAGEHVKSYLRHPHCEVVAISSRQEKSARRLAADNGLDCAIYTSYEDLLADPKVDVISLCTPNDLHPAETIAGARAGKHLLIEKPVALTLADLREMNRVVQESGVRTVVGFVLHWNPLFGVIKGLLADGAIGRIFYAEVDYWHGIGPWYKQWDWVWRKDAGGSSFLAAGCHAVDALRYFVQREVVEVAAYEAGPRAGYEYSPTAVAVVKFEDGAVGKLSSSLDVVGPYQFNIDLLGEEGTIRNNRVYSKRLMPGQTGFAEIPTILPDSGDVTHHPFDGEIADLVDCIRNDRESEVNLADAVKTHELILAIDQSAAEGQVVKLPLG